MVSSHWFRKVAPRRIVPARAAGLKPHLDSLGGSGRKRLCQPPCGATSLRCRHRAELPRAATAALSALEAVRGRRSGSLSGLGRGVPTSEVSSQSALVPPEKRLPPPKAHGADGGIDESDANRQARRGPTREPRATHLAGDADRAERKRLVGVAWKEPPLGFRLSPGRRRSGRGPGAERRTPGAGRPRRATRPRAEGDRDRARRAAGARLPGHARPGHRGARPRRGGRASARRPTPRRAR